MTEPWSKEDYTEALLELRQTFGRAPTMAHDDNTRITDRLDCIILLLRELRASHDLLPALK